MFVCVFMRVRVPKMRESSSLFFSFSSTFYQSIFIDMSHPKRYLAQFNQRQMPLKHSYSKPNSPWKTKEVFASIVSNGTNGRIHIKNTNFPHFKYSICWLWLSVNSTTHFFEQKQNARHSNRAFTHSKLDILHPIESECVRVWVCVSCFLLLVR